MSSPPISELERSYLGSFAQLKDFYENGKFTDVTFLVDQSVFKAHKVILCCHSPVFEAMFTAGMTEARDGHVVVDDIKPHIFKSLLDFVYTGARPSLTTDDTVDLFIAADKYGVASLASACESRLADGLTCNNVVELLCFADNFKTTTLQSRVYRFMRLHMSDVVKTDGWSLIADDVKIQRRLITINTQRSEQVNSMLYSYTRHSTVHRSFFRSSRHSWSLQNSLRPFQYTFPGKNFSRNVYILVDSWDVNGVRTVSANAYVQSTLDGPFILNVRCFFVRKNGDETNETVVNEQNGLFCWEPSSAHPTLGNPRAEVFRSEVPDDVDTFSIELAPTGETDESGRVPPQRWRFESTDDDAFPPRSAVDLALLRRSRNSPAPLLLYLEHVLVWDLDPYNVFESIEAGHELGLGFLKWGSLEYFKMKSALAIKSDSKTWLRLQPPLLTEILIETTSISYPLMLPPFLVEPCKLIRKNHHARKKLLT